MFICAIYYYKSHKFECINLKRMKTYSFIGLDSMECEEKCLQIISKYYGKYFLQQRP